MSVQLTVPQIILGGLPPEGLSLLAGARDELAQALMDISKDYANLSPSPAHVLRVFRECPKPKAVLLGQDPYPTAADGLSFSCQKIKPSLKNIIACLRAQQLMAGEPKTGDLSAWSAEGVMLLNTALTTRQGTRGAHVKAWTPFTRKIVEILAGRDNPPVFILLGDHARAFEEIIAGVGATSLSWGHPSPINTINASHDNPAAFINCTVFARTNAVLESRGESPIRWGILAAPTAVECIDPTGGASICEPAATVAPSKPLPPADITRGMFAQDIAPGELDLMMSSKKLWFFTDGGATANGRPTCRASWGVCVKSEEHGVIVEKSCLVRPPASNNRGELSAMVVAILMIEYVLERGYAGTCIIGYDSEYAACSLTTWSLAVTSGGNPRKNVDIIKPAREWLEPVLSRVTFAHIHSHKKPPTDPNEYFLWHGNDRADKLCAALLVKA